MIPRASNSDKLNERREHLVSTITEVMLRKGFHKTTIRDMAAAAGWSMGQLYFYISRKEDVLFLITEDILEDVYGSLEAIRWNVSYRNTLEAAITAFFDACRRKSHEIALLYRETASMLPEHREKIKAYELRERSAFVDLLEGGIKAGEFRQVQSDMFAEVIIILAHSWILKGWALRDTIDFEGFKNAQLDFIFSYLSSPARGGASDNQSTGGIEAKGLSVTAAGAAL
ncbi:MAG: TetR/AcrR family transcriptional regulator [Dehalococcoidia bacterium]